MQQIFTNILFVSDLTESSRYAFNYAMSIAFSFHATIDLIYVISDFPEDMRIHIYNFLGDELWEKYKEKKESYARSTLIGKKRDITMAYEALEIICDESQNQLMNSQSLINDIVIKEGGFIQEISKQIKQKKYGMIVLSYSTLSNLKDSMISGKIKRLVKNADIPILLIPSQEH